MRFGLDRSEFLVTCLKLLWKKSQGMTELKTLIGLFAAVLALVCLASPVVAQESATTPLLSKGTQELSVSGRLELPESDELDYDIDGSYGYFFRDGWEVGVQVLAADFGGRDRLEISGFTEYNFKRQTNIVPYLGGAIGLVTADFDNDVVLSTTINDDDGLVFDMEGGVKFFVRPYMAVSLAINFKFATDDVFATDNSVEDNLTSVKIGMRYYF
jgi:hypothetical protein